MPENTNPPPKNADQPPVQVGMVLVHRVPLGENPNWAVITKIGSTDEKQLRWTWYQIKSPNENLDGKTFSAEDNRWIRFPPR